MAEIPEADRGYLEAALAAAAAARAFLAWLDQAAERLAPERLTELGAEAGSLHEPALRAARERLQSTPVPESLGSFGERLRAGFEDCHEAGSAFATLADQPASERIPRLIALLRLGARAQERLYPLRQALAPLHGLWDLPGVAVDDRQAHPGDEHHPPTGVVHVSRGGAHGGFSLYVPETYTAERAWPVIVALHGGSGEGRSFLWSWLREARSRAYLLLAPKSLGDTWDVDDDRGLLQILTWLGRNFRIDEQRILLTGLSDGATFGLLYGLAHPSVYRALAPMCGVFHPANEVVGNLERARGVPVYLVHGALDFLFPVFLAHHTRDTLLAAGAEVTYRELPQLSHTHPRSENVRVLDWFEALPPLAPASA